MFNSRIRNKILHGDCLDVLQSFDDSTFEGIIFSPPYDNIRDYQGEWKINFPKLGKALYRVMADGGICAVVIGDGTKNCAKSLTSFKLAVDWCENAGWRLFECCIYNRDGNPGAWWSNRFRVDHEYILLFLKGAKPKTFKKDALMVPSKHAGKVYSGTDRLTNGGVKKIKPKAVNKMKCRGSVWRYSTSNTEGNKVKKQHPATYPDALARDLIFCFTRPDDLVLDPMCGSGTTCVVAAQNKRNYVGIDISEEYCALSEERLTLESSQDKLFVLAERQEKYA